MFGLLDLYTKRINHQIAEYAAVQADIARRLQASWLAPLQIRLPLPIAVERRPGRRRPGAPT